jgi:hypothetical protein
MTVHLRQAFNKTDAFRRLVVFLSQRGGQGLAQRLRGSTSGIAGHVGLSGGGRRAAIRRQVSIHDQDTHSGGRQIELLCHDHLQHSDQPLAQLCRRCTHQRPIGEQFDLAYPATHPPVPYSACNQPQTQAHHVGGTFHLARRKGSPSPAGAWTHLHVRCIPAVPRFPARPARCWSRCLPRALSRRSSTRIHFQGFSKHIHHALDGKS